MLKSPVRIIEHEEQEDPLAAHAPPVLYSATPAVFAATMPGEKAKPAPGEEFETPLTAIIPRRKAPDEKETDVEVEGEGELRLVYFR